MLGVMAIVAAIAGAALKAPSITVKINALIKNKNSFFMIVFSSAS
jgi:hypothetical protein